MRYWLTLHLLARGYRAFMDAREPGKSAPHRMREDLRPTLEWPSESSPEAATRPSSPDSIKLLAPLGAGGMGAVWLGFDSREGAYVAVKMILPHLAGDQEAVSRFHREIRIVRRLRSSRSVKLRAWGTSRGRPFAVLDRVPGESLSRHSAHGRLLPVYDVVSIVDQLLAALEELHAEGVIHRDVKPANIMLSRRKRFELTLVDFGVASSLQEGALEGDRESAAGTVSHMSPEQLLAESHGDPREDLWAAAVVAYECLFGRLPFEGPHFSLAQMSVHAGLPMAPTLLRADLPAPLDDWFARAFARDPVARFTSAGEMRAAWQQATADIGGSDGPTPRGLDEGPAPSSSAPTVRPRRESPRGRALRWGPRRKVALALTSAFLLALATGLFLLPSPRAIRASEANAEVSEQIEADLVQGVSDVLPPP